MGKGPEYTLHQGGHTDGQQTHEKMLTVTMIREMQIKTTMRYHFTPIRMAIINKLTKNKCWQGCRKETPRALLVGMQVGVATKKQYGVSSKN